MVTPNMTVPNTKNRPRIPRTPKTNIIGNTGVCRISLAISLLINGVIFGSESGVFGRCFCPIKSYAMNLDTFEYW